MNEKQNGVLSHSGGYCKGTDSLSINMKNLQHSNYQKEQLDNSVLPKREEGGFCAISELEHLKVVDHVVMETESGGRDLSNGNDLGDVLYNQRGSKTLTCNEESRDKVLNNPEFAHTMTSNDCVNGDEHKLSDSGAQIITSKLFPADSSLFTDKSVMEHEVPQFIDCCKDIDCQHVKDICVDKGEPLEEKGSIDKHTENFVGLHFSKPSSEYQSKETIGNLDSEFHIADGLKSPAQSDLSDVTVDRREAKEEKCIPPVPSEHECLHVGKVNENGLNPEAFILASKTNVEKIERYVMVEDSLVTNVLPLENFGTRGFLQSVMDPLNSQGDVDSQHPNLSMKVDLKGADEELEPDKANQNVDGTTLDFCYKPTGAGSMTNEVSEETWKAEVVPHHNHQNFIDPFTQRVQHSDMDESEQEYALENELQNSSNPFLVSDHRSSGTDRSIVDTQHETPPNVDSHSRNPFGVEVQSTIIKVSTEESLPATIVNHKENCNPFAFGETESPTIVKDNEAIYEVPAESPKRSTNNPFSDCEVKSADIDKNFEGIDQQHEFGTPIAITNNSLALNETHSSSEVKSIKYSGHQPELNHKGSSYNPFDNPDYEVASLDKIDGKPLAVIVPGQQSFQLRDMLNHEGAPKIISFADQGMAGVGETSFAAVSGRMTYSGPIAVSGSTSLRSDSSTTSTRSFAFPVLQSEWNSSPVRMERADRRKRRGSWKHGILCCKF